MDTIRNMSRRTKIIVISSAAVLLIAAIITLTWALIPNTGIKNASAAQSPTPGAASPKDALIKQLSADLQNPQLSLTEQASLHEKLRIAQKMNSQQLAVAESRGPKDAPVRPENSLLPEAQAIEVTEDEIIEGSEGVIETWVAEIQNLWQGQREGIFYQVLAGADAEDPAQGILIFIEIHPGLISRSQLTIPAPAKNGALRILSVEGNLIQLVDQQENHLTFDIQKRAFVEQ